tara:strand:- start:170 stop:391 length:222 start_codon:yes stop_codon:yes gene_type:complete
MSVRDDMVRNLKISDGSKSVLARENISIEHSNTADTVAFDVNGDKSGAGKESDSASDAESKTLLHRRLYYVNT